MPPQINADTTSFLIFDIARLLHGEFERRVGDADLGVTPGEARTLATVACFGPLRQSDLGEVTGMGAMSVTAFLDRLEKSGLIRRDPDPQDRRAKLVQVTEEAAPLLAALKGIGDRVRAVTRGSIADDDWDRFHSLLRVARDNHLAARRCRREEGAA
jgi:DNA-binding MarR family transcriptional regulator